MLTWKIKRDKGEYYVQWYENKTDQIDWSI